MTINALFMNNNKLALLISSHIEDEKSVQKSAESSLHRSIIQRSNLEEKILWTTLNTTVLVATLPTHVPWQSSSTFLDVSKLTATPTLSDGLIMRVKTLPLHGI